MKLLLRPYESIFVVFGENTEACVENRKMKETTGGIFSGFRRAGWSMESSSYDTYPAFEAVEEHTLAISQLRINAGLFRNDPLSSAF